MRADSTAPHSCVGLSWGKLHPQAPPPAQAERPVRSPGSPTAHAWAGRRPRHRGHCGEGPGRDEWALQVAPLIARRKRACLGGRGVPGPRQDGRRGHTTLGDSPAAPRERRGLFIRFRFPPIK